MRNRKGYQMSVGTIVTIVLLMSVLILGLALVRTIFNPQPQFTITEEVCEEKPIGFKLILTETVTTNYEVTQIMINGRKFSHCYTREEVMKEFPNCNSSLCVYNTFLESDYILETRVEKKECNESFDYNDVIYGTICSQVEVDEYSKDPNSNWIKIKEDGTEINLETEWLYENAECLNYCRERFGKIMCPVDEETKISGNYKCSTYKIRNYTIKYE